MRRPSRPAASSPPRSPPGGCRPPRPGAADRGPPPRDRAGPDAAAAGPDRSRARPWTAGWRPWPAATRSPSARWSRRWAGTCRAARAAWWPASRPRCCAASSTRPDCPPGALTARSWTATCRWGRRGGAGPGTARRAWPSGTAGGCWPGGWAGCSPAPPTVSCCVTPARPAGRCPAPGPAAPQGSTRPAAAPTPSSGTSCCGADLREVTPRRLAPGHPVLAAQRWTGDPAHRSMTPGPRETATRSATWASSHPGCCARHRRPSSPAPARRRWPPGANGTSSHLLPGASRAGSRPPAPR